MWTFRIVFGRFPYPDSMEHAPQHEKELVTFDFACIISKFLQFVRGCDILLLMAPSIVSESCIDFIVRALKNNPEERARINELWDHHWFDRVRTFQNL